MSEAEIHFLLLPIIYKSNWVFMDNFSKQALFTKFPLILSRFAMWCGGTTHQHPHCWLVEWLVTPLPDSSISRANTEGRTGGSNTTGRPEVTFYTRCTPLALRASWFGLPPPCPRPREFPMLDQVLPKYATYDSNAGKLQLQSFWFSKFSRRRSKGSHIDEMANVRGTNW